jgi:ketosteroid isomerase-like protein
MPPFDRFVAGGYIPGAQAWHRTSCSFKETDMADNAQMIIDLDRKRMTAMAEKDVAALKTMLCKGLVYTHSTGRQDTKQSLIDNMESGKTVYTSMVPSEVKAQDVGNAVVLTGVAAISVNSNGKPNSFRVRFTDVYENQNGTWRMITWQSTKLPD